MSEFEKLYENLIEKYNPGHHAVLPADNNVDIGSLPKPPINPKIEELDLEQMGKDWGAYDPSHIDILRPHVRQHIEEMKKNPAKYIAEVKEIQDRVNKNRLRKLELAQQEGHIAPEYMLPDDSTTVLPKLIRTKKPIEMTEFGKIDNLLKNCTNYYHLTTK